VEAIENEFQAEFQFTFQKAYNAHFGMELPVICSGEENKIQSFRWGIVPFWSKEPNLKFHNTTSPAREIVKNSLYKIPVRRRRCLVPANCFFIWYKSGGSKTPYVVYDSRHRLMSFAGIWDTWQNAEKTSLIHSFSIITTEPCKRLSNFTGQMPVIITEGRRRKYLRQSNSLMEVMQMLRPSGSDTINLYPVSDQVNIFNNNTRDILFPAGERIYKEVVYEQKVYLKLEGMGSMKDNPDRKPQLKLMI
jgi:putative SOS response-associated peptidase YedK